MKMLSNNSTPADLSLGPALRQAEETRQHSTLVQQGHHERRGIVLAPGQMQQDLRGQQLHQGHGAQGANEANCEGGKDCW